MVSVMCTVNKGDLPLSITWMLNGKAVSKFAGITILQTNKRISQLSIESIQDKHIGEYNCVANNIAGTVSHFAYLHINGTS